MPDSYAAQFIRGTPPITRVLMLAIVLTTLLVYLNVLQPQQLSYSKYYLLRLQLHRIFTCFLYYGKLNLELILHIVFMYRYSTMLEESYTRTSDYFYLLLLVSGLLFVLSNIYYIPLLGSSLSCTITYIWTRRNPQAVVQIMGFISFYAFYLPFIVPLFTLVFEGRVSMDEIVGIIVGHFIYYLQDVYPRVGRSILRTPCWCHRLFNERDTCCEAKKEEKPTRSSRRISDIRKGIQERVQAEDGAGSPEQNGLGLNDSGTVPLIEEKNNSDDEEKNNSDENIVFEENWDSTESNRINENNNDNNNVIENNIGHAADDSSDSFEAISLSDDWDGAAQNEEEDVPDGNPAEEWDSEENA